MSDELLDSLEHVRRELIDAHRCGEMDDEELADALSHNDRYVRMRMAMLASGTDGAVVVHGAADAGRVATARRLLGRLFGENMDVVVLKDEEPS
jgi:hypothetical protein